MARVTLTAHTQGKDRGGSYPRPLTAPTSKTNTTMRTETKTLDELVQMAQLATKEVLTSEEAARYLGVSKSYLYKMTMRKEIPHYKPMGKMCYFNREELEQWLQRNRIATDEELNQQAAAYCQQKGGRK